MTEEIKPVQAEQAIVEAALQTVHDRSFAGRNPHLGKMVNCQFCGLRHRENERQCKQKFAEKDG